MEREREIDRERERESESETSLRSHVCGVSSADTAQIMYADI